MILERLMKALAEDEHAKLRERLQLPRRSEKILDRFRSTGDAPSTRELCEEFGLTKSNLYRICSEIADECIRILATTGEFPKLAFYHKKFLASEFNAELLRTEKKLLEHADPDQLERFFGYAFDALIGFPVNDIDLALTASYGTKWHRAKRNPPPDDELAITMRLIYVQVCALPARKKLTVDKMHTIARSLIDDVADRAAVSPHPLARYYYYQSEWKAANYDNVTGEGRTIWLSRSCELIEQNESWFSPGSLESNLLQLKYERALYCGEAEEAFAQFEKSYRGQIPDSSRNALILIRFVRISLLVRRFDKAEEIMAVLEAYPYTKMTTGIYHPYLLLRAALDLFANKIDEAEHDVNLGFAYNTEPRYFLSYEVEWRALEVICAYKRNDLERTDLLVTRHTKWLHSRRYALAQSPWPYFYKTIRAFIVYRQTGKQAGMRLRKQFEEFKYTSRHYAMLLEPEINDMFAD